MIQKKPDDVIPREYGKVVQNTAKEHEKEVMEKLICDGEIPTKANKPYEIMFEKVKG